MKRLKMHLPIHMIERATKEEFEELRKLAPNMLITDVNPQYIFTN